MFSTPVRAQGVWGALNVGSRGRTHKFDFVYPRYIRLVMGSTHSVNVLMRINTRCVGIALRSSSQLLRSSHSAAQTAATSSSTTVVVDMYQRTALSRGNSDYDMSTSSSSTAYTSLSCTDSISATAAVASGDALAVADGVLDGDSWYPSYSNKAVPQGTVEIVVANLSVDSWLTDLRSSRLGAQQTLVVLHLFGGERRHDDLHGCLEVEAAKGSLPIRVYTLDLFENAQWDLSKPEVVFQVLTAVGDGPVCGIVAGPPCATWIELRFLPVAHSPCARVVNTRWVSLIPQTR